MEFLRVGKESGQVGAVTRLDAYAVAVRQMIARKPSHFIS
jgi:hypothetical protein